MGTLDTLKGFVEASLLLPHVEHTFTFDEVGKAFAQSASGTTVGKIAITP